MQTICTFYLIHDAEPKVVDAPLMLIIRMGQGVSLFVFNLNVVNLSKKYSDLPMLRF
jgi:hypothetical protein